MISRRISLIGAFVAALATSAFAADAPAAAIKDPITISYHRCDAVYTNWGVHLWEDPNMPLEDIEWSHPMMPTSTTPLWISWQRASAEFGNKIHVNYIIHRGDIKEQGGKDMGFDGRTTKSIWVINKDATIYTSQADAEAHDPCFKK